MVILVSFHTERMILHLAIKMIGSWMFYNPSNLYCITFKKESTSKQLNKTPKQDDKQILYN